MDKELKKLKRFYIFTFIGAVLLVSLSFTWYLINEKGVMRRIAKKEALANHNKDVFYRKWASMHGGVYVPVSEFTKPNKYLDVNTREVTTDDGQLLTLINPAYMTRQVLDISKGHYGIHGNITSLNPLRPGNAPDEWEAKVLSKFEEEGLKEFTEIVEENGVEVLRYMKPMIAEESCLKCHMGHGYDIGDIRGGISVSVPMTEYNPILYANFKLMAITHSGILLFMLTLLSLWYKNQKNEIVTRCSLKETILKQKENLETQNQLLEVAKEKAEQSDHFKSAFLANMSHEIRTPMNGILGFANLLKTPGLKDEEQVRYVDIIKKSGDRMLRTLNDIIEISKIEAGQLVLHLDQFSIVERLKNQFEFFTPLAQEKGLELKISLDFYDEAATFSDISKFDSIVSILVHNAIKFTESGSIKISGEKDNNTYKLCVEDTGIGIAKEKQAEVFNHFEQADVDAKLARKGSGLGLSIAKSYVEFLGGKIWLVSEVNKGTSFFFTIPERNQS